MIENLNMKATIIKSQTGLLIGHERMEKTNDDLADLEATAAEVLKTTSRENRYAGYNPEGGA